MSPIKIVLGGPPHSGKSVLQEGLKNAFLSLGYKSSFFFTGAPDGEGCWYQITVRYHPELAHKLKTENKQKFSTEFTELIASHVNQCQLPLTIIDIGGLPSEENEKICRGATHIIILSGDPQKFDEWREFANKTKLIIIAEILSEYHGKQDEIKPLTSNNILRGSIHHLERGEDVSGRPMVQALAKHSLNLLSPTTIHKITEEREVLDPYVEIIRKENVFDVKFIGNAQNDKWVKEAYKRLDEMETTGEILGGGPIKITGKISMAVIVPICHKLAQYFSAISIFDPRLNRYVVVISNNPGLKVGELIE